MLIHVAYGLADDMQLHAEELVRLAGLILLHIRTAFAGTERAKRRLWIDQYLDYGWEIPDSSIAVLLGLVYW